MAMLLEFMEKFGMGFAIGFYPAGDAAAQAEMGETLKNMRHDNHVLIPRTNGDPSLDAYGIEIVQPTPAGAETLKSIITELFGDRIKRYILGQTLTTESNGAGLGSSGISDLHKWSFYQIIKSDAIDLEETITNELLKPLIRFNFPEYSNLDIRFKIETDSPDVMGQLEAFNIAYQMGLKIKAEDVYNTVGLSRPTEDDEVLEMAQQTAGLDPTGGIGGQVGGNPFGKGVHETLKETISGHREEENAMNPPK
jgi:phage gp29-like protein